MDLRLAALAGLLMAAPLDQNSQVELQGVQPKVGSSEPGTSRQERPNLGATPTADGGSTSTSGAADSGVPDSVSQAEFLKVVVANKAGLTRCFEEQKKREPGLSGKVVMRWTILPNGETSGVTSESDQLKTPFFGECVGALIKRWTFPRHKVQGEPVAFPMRF